MYVALEGTRALADRATASFDAAWSRAEQLDAPARGELATHVAIAKVAATQTALDVATRIFDVTSAGATSATLGLDRFWRNLRTHTLHDPVDEKLRELGDFALNAVLPTPSFYS
jgi:alkylation response protein AidB-like acyl-CoA dehydrogenase